jgi:hypothetical protein
MHLPSRIAQSVVVLWIGAAAIGMVSAAQVPPESRNLLGIWCESRGRTPPAELRKKWFYERIIRSVAAHVDTLPKAVREKIVYIQSAEGSTGDVAAYKGTPLDRKFEIAPAA